MRPRPCITRASTAPAPSDIVSLCQCATERSRIPLVRNSRLQTETALAASDKCLFTDDANIWNSTMLPVLGRILSRQAHVRVDSDAAHPDPCNTTRAEIFRVTRVELNHELPLLLIHLRPGNLGTPTKASVVSTAGRSARQLVEFANPFPVTGKCPRTLLRSCGAASNT
jgi:hypothetical protein